MLVREMCGGVIDFRQNVVGLKGGDRKLICMFMQNRILNYIDRCFGLSVLNMLIFLIGRC